MRLDRFLPTLTRLVGASLCESQCSFQAHKVKLESLLYPSNGKLCTDPLSQSSNDKLIEADPVTLRVANRALMHGAWQSKNETATCIFLPARGRRNHHSLRLSSFDPRQCGRFKIGDCFICGFTLRKATRKLHELCGESSGFVRNQQTRVGSP